MPTRRQGGNRTSARVPRAVQGVALALARTVCVAPECLRDVALWHIIPTR